MVGWFPEPTWLQSMLAYQARAAGKDSYNLFTQLGDVRGQAAALLVQSHVCIKSKNQELDFSVMDEINILVGRKTNVIPGPCMLDRGVQSWCSSIFESPKTVLNSIGKISYSCVIYRTKSGINFLFGLEKQLNFIQKVCQFVQHFFLGFSLSKPFLTSAHWQEKERRSFDAITPPGLGEVDMENQFCWWFQATCESCFQ